MALKQVKPDAQGRINLGSLTKGVSAYSVTLTKDHKIILEPFFDIPNNEQWLLKDKSTLAKVQRGLKDAARGRIVDKGSFAKYADDD